jgi:small subunit ribosomal protein S19
MAKIFSFRGKKMEEIQALSLEEVVKLLPARQRRTLKRGLTDTQTKLLKKLKKRKGSDRPIKTKSRDMIILPEMVGARLAVHSGREFTPVTILPEHIGHYLGELVLTRQRVRHGAPGFGATRGSKFVPLK